MKLTLSQSTYELRDAGEVAFGILVMAILMGAGALLLGVVVAAMLVAASVSAPVPQGTALPHLLPISATLWTAGMVFVVRHYRRVTRTWTDERRGGDMLFLVECIAAVAGFGAWLLAPQNDQGLVYALRICLASFQLLLIGSHVVTYMLLGYVPKRKEITAWSTLAVVVILEFSRNG